MCTEGGGGGRGRGSGWRDAAASAAAAADEIRRVAKPAACFLSAGRQRGSSLFVFLVVVLRELTYSSEMTGDYYPEVHHFAQAMAHFVVCLGMLFFNHKNN